MSKYYKDVYTFPETNGRKEVFTKKPKRTDEVEVILEFIYIRGMLKVVNITPAPLMFITRAEEITKEEYEQAAQKVHNVALGVPF
jgi:putative NADPH-quinone reductase